MNRNLTELSGYNEGSESNLWDKFGKYIAPVCLAATTIVGNAEETKGMDDYTLVTLNISNRLGEIQKTGLIDCGNNSLRGQKIKLENNGILTESGKQVCKTNESFLVSNSEKSDFLKALKYFEQIGAFKPSENNILLSGGLEGEFTVALEGDEVYIFNKGNKIKIGDLNRDNLNKIDFENLDYATLGEVYISFIIILIIVLGFGRFGHDFIKKTIGEKKKEEITTIGKKRERIISFFRYYFKEDDVKSNEILANMNMMSFRFTKKEGIETLKYQEAFGYNSYSPLYIYFVNCLINGETFDDFFERLSRIEERRVLLDEIKPFLDGKEFNPSFELKFEGRKVTENIPKDWED